MSAQFYRGCTYRLVSVGADVWRWECSGHAQKVDGITIGDEIAAERACKSAIDKLWYGEAARMPGE